MDLTSFESNHALQRTRTINKIKIYSQLKFIVKSSKQGLASASPTLRALHRPLPQPLLPLPLLRQAFLGQFLRQCLALTLTLY